MGYFLMTRYTALDCAYVAEHLEVAEVLMEAGGLSVTKIMEVAATKIQALARGYIIRKNKQRMKLWIHHRDEVLYSMYDCVTFTSADYFVQYIHCSLILHCKFQYSSTTTFLGLFHIIPCDIVPAFFFNALSYLFFWHSELYWLVVHIVPIIFQNVFMLVG